MPFLLKTKADWDAAKVEILRAGVKLDALPAASQASDVAALRVALGLVGKDPGLVADTLATLEGFLAQLAKEAGETAIKVFDPGFAAEYEIIAGAYEQLTRLADLLEKERKRLAARFPAEALARLTLGFEMETKLLKVVEVRSEDKANMVDLAGVKVPRIYKKELITFNLRGKKFLGSEVELTQGGGMCLEHVTEKFDASSDEALDCIEQIRTAYNTLSKTLTVTQAVAGLNKSLTSQESALRAVANPTYKDRTIRVTGSNPFSSFQVQGNYSFPLEKVGEPETGLVTLMTKRGVLFGSAIKAAEAFVVEITKRARAAFPADKTLGAARLATWPWTDDEDLERRYLRSIFAIHIFNGALHRWLNVNADTVKDNFDQLIKTPVMDLVRKALLPHTRNILAALFLDAHKEVVAKTAKKDNLIGLLHAHIMGMDVPRTEGFGEPQILGLTVASFVPGQSMGFYSGELDGQYSTKPSAKDRHFSMRRAGLCPTSNPILPVENAYPTSTGGSMKLYSVVIEARHGSDTVSKIVTASTRTTSRSAYQAVATLTRSKSFGRVDPEPLAVKFDPQSFANLQKYLDGRKKQIEAELAKRAKPAVIPKKDVPSKDAPAKKVTTSASGLTGATKKPASQPPPRSTGRSVALGAPTPKPKVVTASTTVTPAKKEEEPDVLKLALALSVIDQVVKAPSLVECYRTIRCLKIDQDLTAVAPAEMYDYITTTVADLLSALSWVGGLGDSILRESAVPRKAWQKVGDFRLTEAHLDMLTDDGMEELLDDRLIDAFTLYVEQQRAAVRRRYDIPVGLLVGSNAWVPPADVQAARNGAACEYQVINQGGNHWIVAVRFPGENPNTAYVYDSLHLDAVADATQTVVRRCFNLDLADVVHRLQGPQQPGGHECGAYVCAAVEILSRAGDTPLQRRQALAGANFDNDTIRARIHGAIQANNFQNLS